LINRASGKFVRSRQRTLSHVMLSVAKHLGGGWAYSGGALRERSISHTSVAAYLCSIEDIPQMLNEVKHIKGGGELDVSPTCRRDHLGLLLALNLMGLRAAAN